MECLIRDKKREIWQRKVVETQDGKMWDMIRNLKCGPKQENNKILVHENTPRVNERQKARVFISHYKKVSSVLIRRMTGG